MTTNVSNNPEGQFDVGGGGGLWGMVFVYFLCFMVAIKIGQIITYIWAHHPWLP